MVNGNCSKSLRIASNLYNLIRKNGLDVYSVTHYHGTWRGHLEGSETSRFLFLLPDRIRHNSNERVILLEEDINRLTAYSKNLFRSYFPLEKIISGNVGVEPAKEVSTYHLKRLIKEHVISI